MIGVVGGKLLYELNPSLWENAAAGVEDDTPPDGAIDDGPNRFPNGGYLVYGRIVDTMPVS